MLLGGGQHAEKEYTDFYAQSLEFELTCPLCYSEYSELFQPLICCAQLTLSKGEEQIFTISLQIQQEQAG